MNDASPWLSKIVLAYGALGATLNLVSSIRRRGIRRAFALFALATGLPALGELLVTGPLGLLRHRTRPRLAGVPLAILLGWYCAIHGAVTVAERVLERIPLDGAGRPRALPLVAAAVGTSLDLVLDPAGLDAGLWEWKTGGFYASDVRGPNGRSGIPLVNFLGWLALVAGVAEIYGRTSEGGPGQRPGGWRLPAVLLLPYYLAAVAWAVRRRRWRYLVYSIPFPVALYAALRER